MYNYFVIDEKDGRAVVPENWKGVFEESIRTRGQNFSGAECFEFSSSTPDSEFTNAQFIRQYLTPGAAKRLVNGFRQLMEYIRPHEDDCWVRTFTSLRELNVEHCILKGTSDDRISSIIGVGSMTAKYTPEHLAMRNRVSHYCGLEVFIDMGTPDKRAIILLMVDKTQFSRLGRLLRGSDPVYSLPGTIDAIIEQWTRTFDENPSTYPWSNHAWFDCVMNNGLDQFRNMGCHPVLGSLGFGVIDEHVTEPDEAIWWEFGNAQNKVVDDFVTKMEGQAMIDAHFWLEDGEGRVFDVIRPIVLLPLLNSGQRVPDERFPKSVCGMTKEQCQTAGFHYRPAPRDTQRLLFTLLMRQQKPVWDCVLERSPEFFSYLRQHPMDV
jgi:hypothetical protein